MFSGPINHPSDPVYRREWKLPRAYWKVVAMVHTTRDALSATAYMVSQEHMIDGLEFAFGSFRTFQVPVHQIEALTGLVFWGPDGDRLRSYDVLNDQESGAAMMLGDVEQVQF